MRNMRRSIVAVAGFVAACAPVPQQAAPPAAAPAAATPAAALPALPRPPQPPIPPGSTVLACTPIEDAKPPPGQIAIAEPFSLVIDPSGRPLEFVGGVLPAKIPFQVAKIEPAAGPPEMRVGAVIHYAARDAAHEMYTALAVMKDGTYRLGLMVKTPTQSTNGPVYAGHGTCVDKRA